MLFVSDALSIPLDALQFSYVRSSGPGGQNVNKVASKAVLRWNPVTTGVLSPSVLQRFKRLYPRCVSNSGEIILTSQRTRDALKNKNDCLEKLRTMLLQALKIPKRRIATKPTRASMERRLEGKARNAKKKQRRTKIEIQEK